MKKRFALPIVSLVIILGAAFLISPHSENKNEKTPQIWTLSRQLLTQYSLSLDIVYDDPAFPVKGKYPQIYYWNHTITSSTP